MLWNDMLKDVEVKRPEFLKSMVFKEGVDGEPLYEYEKNYQLSIQVTEEMPPNEVIAIISTEETDRYGDVVRADGGVFDYWEANKVVLFGHNSNALPVGQGIWIKKEPGKVISKFRFNDSAFAQDVNKLVKSGDLRATSIGFIPVEADWIKDPVSGQETGGIEFTKWELLEYSVVPVPANRGALMQAVGKGMGMTDKMKDMLKLGEAPEMEKDAPKTEEKAIVAVDTTPEENSSETASDDLNSAHAQITKQIADKLKEAGEEIDAKDTAELEEIKKAFYAEIESIKKELEAISESLRKAQPDEVQEAKDVPKVDESKAKGREIDKEKSEAIMARMVQEEIAKFLGKRPR